MTTSPVVTITDDLVAELERELAWSDKRSAKILAALLAERAELKRDAERYWWLNDSPCSFGILRAMSTGDLTGPMVDATIDAAMQAAQ